MTTPPNKEAQEWYSVNFSDLVELFNEGYAYGHRDTVEGDYTPIYPQYMREHQADIVCDVLQDKGIDSHSTESAERERLIDLFHELVDYFDGMADADQPAGAASPTPNDEMRFLIEIKELLRHLRVNDQ